MNVLFTKTIRKRIVRAKDTDTVVTGRGTGAPVRVIKNKMSRKYLELAKSHDLTLEEIEVLTLGSLSKAVFNGDMENGSIMAGQSAGLVKEIRSIRDILVDIFEPSRVNKGTL